MKGDFVFLHRSLLDSRVFSDEFMLKLWVWCLLKANWKRGWKNGREIPPGSFATGESSASDQLGVSGGKWRRGIATLKDWGMVTSKATNRFTVISIVKWPEYQAMRRTGDEQVASRRRASDEPVTTIEEGKKGRTEDHKETAFDAPAAEEVQSYIDYEHSLNPNWPRATDLTGESFVDHYNAQGWVAGNGIPIVDWKAKVKTWGNKAPKAGKSKTSGKSAGQQQYENGMAALEGI